MFNVRVKKYLNTEQIQVFSESLLSSGSEREDKRKVIRETGEIVPTNRRILEDCFDMQKKATKIDGLEKYMQKKDTKIEQLVFEYPNQVIGYMLHDSNDEESKRRSYRRTKTKVLDMSKCNNWEWFFTLTFNPEKVDSFDYEQVTSKLSNWFIQMRRKCPDMKYLVVPEQHESGRWHFHGLFENVENMVFVDSGKRDKKGRVIYNVGNYRLGFSTATKIEDVNKASNYIAKYITKEMCDVTKGKKRYWNSRNVQLPEVIDYLIEGKQDMIDYLGENALYIKKVEGFIDVTYMEMPLGYSKILNVL